MALTHNPGRASDRPSPRRWVGRVLLAMLCAGAWAVIHWGQGTSKTPAPAQRETTNVRWRGPVLVDSQPRSTTALEGRVVDPSGDAIAGATVCVLCGGCDISASWPAICATAGASGQFAVDSLPVGRVNVSATHPGYATGFANQGRPIVVKADNETPQVEITLHRATPNLRGRVLDVTGGPVAGARVQVATVTDRVVPAVQLETDDDGVFSASVPDVRLTLRADAPGYAPALAFRARPAAGVELRLTPSSTVRGTVVDSQSHRPVAGVLVRPLGTQAGRLHPGVRSGSDGAFEVDGLEQGRYFFGARGSRYSGQTITPVAVGLGELTSGVVVPVTAGVTVSGQVRSAKSAAACDGGTLQLGSPDAYTRAVMGSEPVEAAVPSVRVRGMTAHVDSNGEVLLEGVLPGQYAVTLHCRGATYEAGPRHILVEDQDLDLKWQVGAGLSLEVNVRDALGEPVPDAGLQLEMGDANEAVLRPLQVDDNGRAVVEGSLRPGRYALHVDGEYGLAPVVLELASGTPRTVVDISLPGSAGIRVQVLSGAGDAVDDVLVRARSLEETAGAVHATGRAVGRGQFLVGPLPPGEYEVEVLDGINAPHSPPQRSVVLAEGEHAAMEVRLGCTDELRGVVVDEQGTPVPDVWVDATDSAASPSRDDLDGITLERPRVLAGTRGEFVIPGVCDGADYDLSGTSTDGAAGSRRAVQAGDFVELRVPRPGRVSGLVSGPGGDPVTRFTLSFLHRETGRQRGVQVVTSDGRFEIHDLPAGRLEIRASAGDISASKGVTLPANGNLSGVALELSARGARLGAVDAP